MANTLENNLTQGNVAKQLVRYALPLVLTSLLQSLYSISDTIIAGRFLGLCNRSGSFSAYRMLVCKKRALETEFSKRLKI